MLKVLLTLLRGVGGCFTNLATGYDEDDVKLLDTLFWIL